MKMGQESTFRLMTYNIGGARQNMGSKLDAVAQVVREAAPDILVVQEATEFQDAEGAWHSILDPIAQAGGFEHVYFGPTLSMRKHMDLRKALFVHALFDDLQDWKQGNAILSRREFVRLGEPSKPGTPRSVPLFRAPLYQGNRDTDPRHALLARVNAEPIFPFVVGLHLTTLVGERGPNPVPGKAERAHVLRFAQARRLLDLLRAHVLEPGHVVFVLGDFNAVAGEACIASVLETEGQFVRLAPSNAGVHTHPKVAAPIDHIFVYPGSRLIKYECWVKDTPVAQRASDHLPVVADVWVN
jgi:endonuclease/exonuclease/phosphatase family metal-dependent hydrolase